MHRHLRTLAAAAFVVLPLLGCKDERLAKAPPPPIEPSAASIAHFCNMAVLDHAGPKGQIFLDGRSEPVWFSSVRDAIAFTLLPEEPKTIAAIYVNDMAKATDWRHPEPGSWVEARAAWFVLGSDYSAAMSETEAVPFSDREAAERFVRQHGGRMYRLAEVPEAYVLGWEAPPAAPAHEQHAEASERPAHAQ
jgi:copper chaperone NosL